MELHRDLSEYWEIFNDDPFVKDELIVLEKVFSLLLFVNEKLILLLLIHDQVFSADNCQPLLIDRFLHSNNLIWFPSFCL